MLDPRGVNILTVEKLYRQVSLFLGNYPYYDPRAAGHKQYQIGDSTYVTICIMWYTNTGTNKKSILLYGREWQNSETTRAFYIDNGNVTENKIEKIYETLIEDIIFIKLTGKSVENEKEE
jgi:hypothetical protein